MEYPRFDASQPTTHNPKPMQHKTQSEQPLSSVTVDDVAYPTKTNKFYDNRKPYQPIDPKKIKSFMPGNILEVYVTTGKEVDEGDKLCILEAMKMKNIIIAPLKGVVKSVFIAPGDKVPKNHILIELE